MMNATHTYGIQCIQFLQNTFQGKHELMMTLSHLGDPRNSFLIYFPLAYCLHKPTGIQVLWLASVSEWINALLKWVLHGDRPYWWIPESSQYNSTANTPVIQQYPLTCESGPGSPSGHAMVTASVVFLMVSSFLQHHTLRSAVQCAIWLAFGVFLLAVNVSRLFIATHFPHQVVIGTALGILLTLSARHVAFIKAKLQTHLLTAIAIPLTCIATFYLFKWLGLDPQWSITMATKHCERAEWLHLDTTLFNAVYRDAGSILGLGLFQWFVATILERETPRLLTVRPGPQPYMIRGIHVVLALFLCQLGESVKPGQHSASFYYFFTCFKFASLVCVVMAVTRVFTENGHDQITITNSKDSKDD